MKIVFLCCNLERGRCGVGDYTSRLASELIRKHNHTVGVVALNDKYIEEEFNGNLHYEDIIFPILRVPAIWKSKSRFAHAEKWITDFDPDWLSLQFVNFGFQIKGLPFGLSKFLIPLGKGRKWHVMLHELWVGMNKQATFKYFLWGQVQKYLLLSLVSKLRPQVIHTQSRVHLAQLKKCGIKSQLLPLFPNISTVYPPSAHTLPAKGGRWSLLNMVIFGSIYPGVPIKTFAKEVAMFQRTHKVPVCLKLIGSSRSRNPKAQEEFATIWKDEGLEIEMLGEQSPERISEVLRSASIGISTTPLLLSDKSGSVAAMLEHGLRVICVSRPYDIRGVADISLSEGIYEYHPGNFENCLNINPPSSSTSRLSKISLQFVNSLTINKGG
jgi:hypothetical protein